MLRGNDALNNRTINLLAKAQGGDGVAWAALYKLYEDRLARAVHKKMGPKLRGRTETADLIQSVWKDVLSDVKQFEYRGPDSLFRWLLLRLIRKIQDKGRYYNTIKRNVDKEEALPDEARDARGRAPFIDKDPTPSQAAIANEDLDRLMRLLDHLPDRQRQTLVFRMRDDMEFERIGEVLGCTAGAARQLYLRALKTCAEVLDREKKKTPEPAPPKSETPPAGTA